MLLQPVFHRTVKAIKGYRYPLGEVDRRAADFSHKQLVERRCVDCAFVRSLLSAIPGQLLTLLRRFGCGCRLLMLVEGRGKKPGWKQGKRHLCCAQTLSIGQGKKKGHVWAKES